MFYGSNPYQLPQFGQQQMNQPQMPSFSPQMPQMQGQGQIPGQGMPQQPGQMSPLAGQQGLGRDPNAPPIDPNAAHQHHGGMNPLMFLSPLAGLFASNPKMGLLSMLSPLLGLSGALGGK